MRLCGRLCDDSHMATNLAIDPKLLEKALEVSGERTKTAVVTRALDVLRDAGFTRAKHLKGGYVGFMRRARA